MRVPGYWLVLQTLPSRSHRRYPLGVSDQAANRSEGPHGVSLLPPDLTEDELNAAPILVSADTLLIDDLTVDEDESFTAALAR